MKAALSRKREEGRFPAATPPLVETLAGAFSLWISAQEVGGSDVQDVAECKEIICFGHPGASLIITDRADGDTKLLRKLQLRQPRGLPFQRVALFEGGHLMQDSNLRPMD